MKNVRYLSLCILALLASATLDQANGQSFPSLDPRMIGDPTVRIGGVPGCSAAIHDLYVVTGPDGKPYRTWHALWHPKGAGGILLRSIPTMKQIIDGKDDPECYFAHEHGDVPLAIAKPQTGAPLPAFGYAALRTGHIEAHPGFKVFTHLAGQWTGWHQPALGWVSPELTAITPDLDMQIMVHQGMPSFKTNVDAPGSTRVTQRFHEFALWARDSQGRVTDVRVMADTGGAIGTAGCGEESIPSGLDPGRRIADGCDPQNTPITYENWQFEAAVQGAWSGQLEADAINPMDYLVNFARQQFANASEELCGIEADRSGCATRLPFGYPGTPALAFMATQRSVPSLAWRWTNAGGAEFICTDAYGQRVNDSRCQAGDPQVLRQRVARINANYPNGGPLIRTGASSMFELAFPLLTNDPARPYDCDRLECVLLMPQGAPLGN